jgi:hypothetical protein
VAYLKYSVMCSERYFHNVHKINLYRADRVCVYVCVFMCILMSQLEIRWTYFDDIWYGRYAIGGYSKLVSLLFYFRPVGNSNLATNELVRWERHSYFREI